MPFKKRNALSCGTFIPLFYGIIACSWMPHWSCHYYRLETHSSFIVGTFNFTFWDSWLSMLIYSMLVLINLLAISISCLRFTAAISSGILHLLIGILHIFRLFSPFKFEVFNHYWLPASSLREVLIVFPFGILCLLLASYIKSNTKRLPRKAASHRKLRP